MGQTRCAKQLHKRRDNTQDDNPASSFQRAFKLLRLTLTLVGRFPYFLLKNPDGIDTYTFRLKSLRGVYFVFTCVLSLSSLSLCTVGVLTLHSETRQKHSDDAPDNLTEPVTSDPLETNITSHVMTDEEFLVDNLFVTVILLSVMTNAVSQGLTHLFHGSSMASYMNLWSRYLWEMDIEASPKALRKKVAKQVIAFNIVMMFFFAMFYIVHPPDIIGHATDAFTLFIIKPFGGTRDPIVFPLTRALARLAIFLGLWSYKVNIFVYEFICALLQNGFRVWNERLISVLGSESDNFQGTRLEYTKLFNDHCRLVTLVDETNKVFSPIVLTYYCTQVVIMCFECFWIARHFGKSDPMQITAAVIIFIQTVGLLYLVSLKASYVFEEAHRGFEISRQHGLTMAKTERELVFLESLTHSYQGATIQMTGGQYFGIDRPFMQDVSGAILTYFIIIIQFNPDEN